jgi:hypothetical protein
MHFKNFSYQIHISDMLRNIVFNILACKFLGKKVNYKKIYSMNFIKIVKKVDF